MNRKITAIERIHGMKFCTFCKQEKRERVKAIYRNSQNEFACEFHKHKLYESDYMTEADYQTWGRL